MLITIALILLLLWFVGMITLGSLSMYVHVLIVFAIIVLILHMIRQDTGTL